VHAANIKALELTCMMLPQRKIQVDCTFVVKTLPKSIMDVIGLIEVCSAVYLLSTGASVRVFIHVTTHPYLWFST
jgi:hypothetical protein